MTSETVPEGIAFGGVIEMWFDSPEQARLAFQTEGCQVAVREDAPKAFLIGKGNGSVGCFVQEHEIPLN